jgi:hypothetical protein
MVRHSQTTANAHLHAVAQALHLGQVLVPQRAQSTGQTAPAVVLHHQALSKSVSTVTE